MTVLVFCVRRLTALEAEHLEPNSALTFALALTCTL